MKRLMNKCDCNRAFADRRRHPFDVAAAHVADGEHSETIRLQQIRRPRQRPSRCPEVLQHLAARRRPTPSAGGNSQDLLRCQRRQGTLGPSDAASGEISEESGLSIGLAVSSSVLILQT
jgi:hypothetical protein